MFGVLYLNTCVFTHESILLADFEQTTTFPFNKSSAKYCMWKIHLHILAFYSFISLLLPKQTMCQAALELWVTASGMLKASLLNKNTFSIRHTKNLSFRLTVFGGRSTWRQKHSSGIILTCTKESGGRACGDRLTAGARKVFLIGSQSLSMSEVWRNEIERFSLTVFTNMRRAGRR